MFYLLIAVLAGVEATPAPLPPGLGCIQDEVSAEDEAAVGRAILEGGLEPADESLRLRVRANVAACVQRFGWDREQTAQMIQLGTTQMALAVAERRLSEVGIDPAAVNRWFDAQSESYRASALTEPSDEEMQAIVDMVATGAVSRQLLEQHADRLGGYIAARVLLFRAERGQPPP